MKENNNTPQTQQLSPNSDQFLLFGGAGGPHIQVHWWWALASATQLGLGVRAFRRGYAGDGRFMPFKAFGVASLFVGAAATAGVGSLNAAGIHKVEDMKEVGANIRTAMRVPPRKQAE